MAAASRVLRAVVFVVLVGCGGNGKGAEDPYEVYLRNNPTPELVLSREDAQIRALLGCSRSWAPGTVDYVLQQAYKKLCR